MYAHKRKFVIKILINEEFNSYLKDIGKTRIGYYFLRTMSIEKAKIWKFKKSCENSIIRLQNKLDPTTHKKYTFKILEITDNQTLRIIKLKKLNK